MASALTGSRTCCDEDAEVSVLGKENSSLTNDMRFNEGACKTNGCRQAESRWLSSKIRERRVARARLARRSYQNYAR